MEQHWFMFEGGWTWIRNPMKGSMVRKPVPFKVTSTSSPSANSLFDTWGICNRSTNNFGLNPVKPAVQVLVDHDTLNWLSFHLKAVCDFFEGSRSLSMPGFQRRANRRRSSRAEKGNFIWGHLREFCILQKKDWGCTCSRPPWRSGWWQIGLQQTWLKIFTSQLFHSVSKR